MGADFAAAVLIAPKKPLSLDEPHLKDWLNEAFQQVTYAAVVTANENGLYGAFQDIIESPDAEAVDHGDVSLSPADARSGVNAALAVITELNNALGSRETGAYDVANETHFMYISGGMSWGEAATQASETFWEFGNLADLLPGLNELLDVHFLGNRSPLKLLSTPLPVVAAAMVTSTDTPTRLHAAQDPFLPLTAVQIELLARDADPAVAAAAGQRVAAALDK